MFGSDGMVGGQRIGRLHKRKTFGTGRVCVEDGCSIRLSQYNSRDRCYQHWEQKPPRFRGEID